MTRPAPVPPGADDVIVLWDSAREIEPELYALLAAVLTSAPGAQGRAVTVQTAAGDVTCSIDLVRAGLRRALALLGEQESEILNLGRALTHRTVIGQAVGMLMQRCGCDADTAVDALKRESQLANRKLREVAQDLVSGHERQVRAVPSPTDQARTRPATVGTAGPEGRR